MCIHILEKYNLEKQKVSINSSVIWGNSNKKIIEEQKSEILLCFIEKFSLDFLVKLEESLIQKFEECKLIFKTWNGQPCIIIDDDYDN